MSGPLPSGDLDEILEAVEDELRSLLGCRVLVTGGTGFVGRWLIEALAWASVRLGHPITVVALSRGADEAARSCAHLTRGAACVEFVPGDVLQLDSADGPALSGTFDAVCHAASPASRELNATDPFAMFRTIADGTSKVLALATRFGEIPFLYTSSGAVYGAQPPGLDHIAEEFSGAPDCLAPESAHHEGKRVAELMCAIAASRGGPAIKVARMFAFLGPLLPLDRHFAAGNFLRDALNGSPIVIQGDGTPTRSYMYASDMTAWLIKILVRGETGRAYNVGSEVAVDIASLARRIAASGPRESRPDVRIVGTPTPGQLAGRYVPSTSRARRELGLVERVGLDDGIARTICWHQSLGVPS